MPAAPRCPAVMEGPRALITTQVPAGPAAHHPIGMKSNLSRVNAATQPLSWSFASSLTPGRRGGGLEPVQAEFAGTVHRSSMTSGFTLPNVPLWSNRINETQLLLWPQLSRIHRSPGRSCGTTTGRDDLAGCADGVSQLTAMLGTPSAAASASGSCSLPHPAPAACAAAGGLSLRRAPNRQ